MMSWIGQLINIPDNPEKLNIFKTVSDCVFTMCQLTRAAHKTSRGGTILFFTGTPQEGSFAMVTYHFLPVTCKYHVIVIQ